MSSNTTHRKQLARAYSAAAQLPYQQALTVVTAAAVAGRLPSPLDDAGRRTALDLLLAAAPTTGCPVPPDAANVDEPDPANQTAPPAKARPQHPRLRVETVIALHQVADLVAIGVSTAPAWRQVAAATPQPKVRAAADAVADALEAGDLTADAMARHSAVFPPVTAALISAGEQSGAYVQGLRAAAEGLKRDAELRQA